MRSPWKLGVALLTTAVLSGSLALGDAQKAPTRKHAKKKEPAPTPSYTPQTLSPVPLDQVPAVPPEVTYRAGQLTIIAHNSTLGDVLRAVRKQTGAELDVPPNATDRVVADLGPGPARDVLATLLNGSHFNYVMLGSPTDPTVIQHIVLTSKSGPETASAAAPQQQQPARAGMLNRFGQPMNGAAAPQMQNNEEAEPQADDTADASDDNAADQSDEQADQQNQGQQQPPKTPEQLLQELQRQQQLGGQPQVVQPAAGGPVVPVSPPPTVYPNGLPNPNPTGNAPEQ